MLDLLSHDSQQEYPQDLLEHSERKESADTFYNASDQNCFENLSCDLEDEYSISRRVILSSEDEDDDWSSSRPTPPSTLGSSPLLPPSTLRVMQTPPPPPSTLRVMQTPPLPPSTLRVMQTPPPAPSTLGSSPLPPPSTFGSSPPPPQDNYRWPTVSACHDVTISPHTPQTQIRDSMFAHLITLIEEVKETQKIQGRILQTLLQQHGNVGTTVSSVPEGFPLKAVCDVDEATRRMMTFLLDHGLAGSITSWVEMGRGSSRP
ncbi:neural Wiskott-Aldrich syndrome protein-like [Thalassophryne amazonica]|uniref:neural Wiskott-Aldrich syndrome protein-like n=1 Tax=Thalassophryne amazonica TaxID=390379 RepID=UPI001470DCA2|nr:neural Wiskott-Aldrich syndrome protein-like [Thalassophryne amazonica]